MDAAWADPFGADDALEFDDAEETIKSNKDGVVFLIDCQIDMFEPNERGEVPFKNALRCAIATLTDKIISAENDLVAVCFYGTAKKSNPNDFEGVYVYFPLDVPDAQRIMDLELLLNAPDFSDIGHSPADFPFCDALWTCSTMFSNCSTKLGHKRIFLFTNDDNPNASDAHVRNQSFQRAKDLAELGIDIDLFSMNKVGTTFDPTLFYQYVISVSEDEFTGAVQIDAAAKFEKLRERVRRKEFKKRAITRLDWRIAEGVTIGVHLYNLVHRAKTGNFSWLDAKTNQPLKTMSKWVCADTGALLMDTQIKHYYEYGGERVMFDKDELAKIKSFDEPGFQLMGFKPKSCLKVYENVRHCAFIYPDETKIPGSTATFAALLDRMHAQDKMAIARLTARRNAAPTLVALLPQMESFDVDHTQVNPSGFHVIYLPYAEDVRQVSVPDQPRATTEQVIKAKKLVKSLRINFDSRTFENPALQKHYANLQALALERDTVEETPDYVMPDEDGMRGFTDLIEDFKTSAFPECYDDIRAMMSKAKRKRTDGAGEGPSKRTKGDVTPSEVRALATNKALNTLTIAQMKGFLAAEKVDFKSTGLRKADYVALVENHCTAADE